MFGHKKFSDHFKKYSLIKHYANIWLSGVLGPVLKTLGPFGQASIGL
jgi:hypothetical protein